MRTVRPPAVAGSFYPGDTQTLSKTVRGLLSAVDATPNGDSCYARAVLAPHAGYVYSGGIAAHAYRQLDPKTKRVLVLGPTHRVGILGMALTGADFQETPLGEVETDTRLTWLLEEDPDVITAPIVHAEEHSIEVHLPFLQEYLEGPFTVVPLAVGQVDAKSVARVIGTALSLPDTAVVISSDLSHFLPKHLARTQDEQTIAQILAGKPSLVPDQACGAYPASGMMRYATDNGLAATTLATGDSADVSGDDSSVVGYVSVAWFDEDDKVVRGAGVSVDGEEAASAGPDKEKAESEEKVEDEQPAEQKAADEKGGDSESFGNLLTWLAHTVIARRLSVEEGPEPSLVDLPRLADLGACFVTLEKNGQLRGCIGSLTPTRRLADDVVENALAAAFSDPRFPPLTARELGEVDVEVSLLSKPKPLMFDGVAPRTESDVARALTPGRDGVILKFGEQRATFLPQVWDQLPNPEEFLSNLKVKAGLPADFWDPNMEVETYTVTAYRRLAGSPEEGSSFSGGEGT